MGHALAGSGHILLQKKTIKSILLKQRQGLGCFYYVFYLKLLRQVKKKVLH